MENLERKPVNVASNYYRIKLLNDYWVISYEIIPFYKNPAIKLTNKFSDSGMFFYEDIIKLKKYYPQLSVRSINGVDIIIFSEFEYAPVK